MNNRDFTLIQEFLIYCYRDLNINLEPHCYFKCRDSVSDFLKECKTIEIQTPHKDNQRS